MTVQNVNACWPRNKGVKIIPRSWKKFARPFYFFSYSFLLFYFLPSLFTTHLNKKWPLNSYPTWLIIAYPLTLNASGPLPMYKTNTWINLECLCKINIMIWNWVRIYCYHCVIGSFLILTLCVSIDTYQDLWKWSVEHPEVFWSEVWDYTNVISSNKGNHVLDRTEKMDTIPVWFKESRLNFAENLLWAAKETPEKTAIIATGKFWLVSWERECVS